SFKRASADCDPSAATTRKSSPAKVISRTLRIVVLSSTARRVLGTWASPPRIESGLSADCADPECGVSRKGCSSRTRGDGGLRRCADGPHPYKGPAAGQWARSAGQAGNETETSANEPRP